MNNIQYPIAAENNAHVFVASEPTKDTTNYLDRLPDEIIAKIIGKLPIKGIFTCRKLCHKLTGIIDDMPYTKSLEKHYQNTQRNTQQNKALFADHYDYQISLGSIKKSFIKFIEKNNLVTGKKLDEIKYLVQRADYYGIQYILAEITQHSTYSLKTLDPISELIFSNICNISNSIKKNSLTLTEDSNILLYLTNYILYELEITEENNIKVSKTIFDDSAINISQRCINSFFFVEAILGANDDDSELNKSPRCSNQLFTNKQNTVTSFHDHEVVNNTRFIHKIDGEYYNITPKDLYDQNSKFIGMFVDKQGNDIFILVKNYAVVFYYMPNKSVNLDSHNIKDYNCKSVDITDENFKVLKVKISKKNNLMLIYGENTTSNGNNKIEVQIYKHNTKIHSCFFNNLPSENLENNFFCSPDGNSFTIIEQTSCDYAKLIFYNIAENKVNKFGNFSINPSEYNLKELYYNNNGTKVIIHNSDPNGQGKDCIISFYPENHISTFYFPATDLRFNKAGNMLVEASNTNAITIMDFRNKNIMISGVDVGNEAILAKFSPNSQLLAVAENGYMPGFPYKFCCTLKIYEFMYLDKNKNLQIHSDPKCIAEYIVLDEIIYFKFSVDCTKLIIQTRYTIKILELVVKPD